MCKPEPHTGSALLSGLISSVAADIFIIDYLCIYSHVCHSHFMFTSLLKPSDSSIPPPQPTPTPMPLSFPPSDQAADESSEEASFYEILPCCARFRCGELIAEGQWHHLVLVMSKGMLKNSMATLYIDGQLVNTVKVNDRPIHAQHHQRIPHLITIIIMMMMSLYISVMDDCMSRFSTSPHCAHCTDNLQKKNLMQAKTWHQ